MRLAAVHAGIQVRAARFVGVVVALSSGMQTTGRASGARAIEHGQIEQRGVGDAIALLSIAFMS